MKPIARYTEISINLMAPHNKTYMEISVYLVIHINKHFPI